MNFEDLNMDGLWNPGEAYNCKEDIKRGISVSGEDPKAPWFSLGENSG